ncbi:hypothetical protein ACFVMA_20760 [Streptomyces rochei]
MTSATLSPVRDGHRASPPPPRARRRLFLTPYLFVAPFYVVFAAFGLYPLVFAFQLSFTD